MQRAPGSVHLLAYVFEEEDDIKSIDDQSAQMSL